MNPHDFMQQVKILNYVSNHIKSQLSFYALETGEVKKVHFQRLIPIINRLLKTDRFKGIVQLLNEDSSETVAQQLLNLFSSLGEIAKLVEGYYLPLPERAIELPKSKELVFLSSTNKKTSTSSYIGLCSGYNSANDDIPTMTLNEWMPSIDVSEFLQIIKKSQPYEILDKPSQVFIPQKNRGWTEYKKIKDNNIREFIAKFNLAQGPVTYFWVHETRNKSNYYQIPNHYLDIAKFAIEKQDGISRIVDCLKINDEFFSVKFNQRIPLAEKKMLMLFALPENLYDPFRWIIPISHYEDFIYIVSRIGIKVPGLSSSKS
ncbi:hypothetical protein [Priestia megaterium]|uniref:hypothetical protein n=1 Tax=Priestia megaterium TaxID=1404 RepID=UPI0020794508|nr:hypothetical protein [Priestia megaterium]USL34004.1 hypothetical protein LIT34_14355 [Priestia megaterium]